MLLLLPTKDETSHVVVSVETAENWVFLNGKVHNEYRKGLNCLFTPQALECVLRSALSVPHEQFGSSRAALDGQDLPQEAGSNLPQPLPRVARRPEPKRATVPAQVPRPQHGDESQGLLRRLHLGQGREGSFRQVLANHAGARAGQLPVRVPRHEGLERVPRARGHCQILVAGGRRFKEGCRRWQGARLSSRRMGRGDPRWQGSQVRRQGDGARSPLVHFRFPR